MGHGDINEELSRLVARKVGTLGAVRGVDVLPSEKPDRISVHLYAKQYPDAIVSVDVDFRFGMTGTFNVTYVEDWGGVEWSARWGRHDNPHNTRDHFHPPPDPNADGTDALDATYPPEPFDVVAVVFEGVESRYVELCNDPDGASPARYDFDPDRCDPPFLDE